MLQFTNHRQRARVARTLLIAVLLQCPVTLLPGQDHQRSYVYSFWGKVVPTPLPYTAVTTIDGEMLGLDPFVTPEDLFVGADGTMMIADTGNDRVVRLDPDLNVTLVLYGFRRPTGVFSVDDRIYVADQGNQRIVVVDLDGTTQQVINAPESELIRDDYRFLPSRIAVDRARRIYVVGPGLYEGVMAIGQGGEFLGFLGSNRVQFHLGDLLWRRLATREQRQGMVRFIPEEYSNLYVDEHGFLFATTQNEDSKHPVKRLNAQGIDVLRREGHFDPVGDIRVNRTGSIVGPSSFVDVALDEHDVYHVLDGKRGRVFTYDLDGNLLSVIGGVGDQLGLHRDAVSLGVFGDRLFVLDRLSARITVFELTEYGRTIREALVRHAEGDYDAAAVLWRRVLDHNANFELANVGIGRILLRQGLLPEAMNAFALGNNRALFSRAFFRQRRIVLREVIPWAFTAMVVVFIALRLIRARRMQSVGIADSDLVRLHRSSLIRRVQYGWYLSRRPFDGFWDLKFEGIGTMSSALITLCMYLLVMVLRFRYAGFLFNVRDLAHFSFARSAVFAVAPVVLFCIGNWSVTSLLNGSGSMRDIFISTSYALVPVVIAFPVIVLFSHVMTLQEGAFIHLVEVTAWIWVAFLLFVGNKTVHEYEVKQAIGMVGLTVVAVGVILFLSLLFLALFEQMWTFIGALYREILFRV